MYIMGSDIWNVSYIELRIWNQVSYDHRSYKQLRIEAWKSQDFNGVEPVTSRYRCDALTNWAMKPLTLEAGHLWVLMSQWRMEIFHISLHILTTVNKVANKQNLFIHLWSIKQRESHYNLQGDAILTLPKVKTTNYCGIKSNRYQGARLWNAIPNRYRQTSNYCSIKHYILRKV